MGYFCAACILRLRLHCLVFTHHGMLLLCSMYTASQASLLGFYAPWHATSVQLVYCVSGFVAWFLRTMACYFSTVCMLRLSFRCLVSTYQDLSVIAVMCK